MYQNITSEIERTLDRISTEIVKIEKMQKTFSDTTFELRKMKKEIEKNEQIQKELALQDQSLLNAHRITH